MGVVIVLVVLAVIGVMLFGLFGLLGLGGMAWVSKRSASYREREIERADEVYAELFDGSRVVTYRVNTETLPADMLIRAGGERGYDLTSRTDVAPNGLAADLVFTRRD